MKKGLRLYKGFIVLLGMACVSMPASASDTEDVRTAREEPVYGAHAQNEEELPFVAGKSYYEYQWGLKNDGTMRRITSVYQSSQVSAANGQDTSRDTQENGGEVGPGITPEKGKPKTGPKNQGGSGQQVSQKVVDSVAGVDIRMEEAWNVYEQTSQRRMVTVAVIDTGVDISHEELRGSLWFNDGEIPGDGIDNDNNGYIDDINGWNFYSGTNQVFEGAEDDHGTHGAGTVAGAWDGQGITGIADGGYVKIMVLKVLGSDEGRGVSANVKNAIRYARDNGADICNLSMGSLTYDEELEQLISSSPMLFVISAGNGDAMGRGYDIDDLPMYPASYPAENIISVGNLLFDGSLDESSNYGRVSVDIAAPGTHILGAVPGGYAYMTGTSMAAPMVTGTAALLYSCRTDLDLMGVREAILNTARKMEGLEGKVATGGMLDAGAAILYGR